MLIPAQRVVDSLVTEFARLTARLPDAGVDGSAAQGIAAALGLLRQRESGGAAFVRGQLSDMRTAIEQLVELLPGGINRDGLRALAARIRVVSQSNSLADLEAGFRSLLTAFETEIAALAKAADAKIPSAAVARLLVDWEAKYLNDQAAQANKAASDGATLRIDADNLQRYLADRFNDSSIVVESVLPLAGGFGKETTIFAANGKSLQGEFVIRRDITGGNPVDNDCHLIHREFPVVRAVHQRGFPGPDAVWLDTEHKLLPGGHFMVMRRAPGKIGGNFFGAQTQVPAGLADSLATTMGRLHALPPLPELGDLTDSICDAWWKLERRDCIRLYIESWLALYRARGHAGSPAIEAIYGWMLDHVPDRRGPPVLLHGDFGFHNFLFHNGELSAVLDWEFAHLGDPAEDLGCVKVTVGGALDWDRLMTRYLAAGGQPVDPATLHYFQIWVLARNAAAASILANCMDTGQFTDLKLTVLPHVHKPNFLRGAQALIESYEKAFG